MKIVPYWDLSDLLGEVFIHSPSDEPVKLSLNRLARAILHDGLGRHYSPMTVWYAYEKHKSLSKPYKQVKEEYVNSICQKRKSDRRNGKRG